MRKILIAIISAFSLNATLDSLKVMQQISKTDNFATEEVLNSYCVEYNKSVDELVGANKIIVEFHDYFTTLLDFLNQNSTQQGYEIFEDAYKNLLKLCAFETLRLHAYKIATKTLDAEFIHEELLNFQYTLLNESDKTNSADSTTQFAQKMLEFFKNDKFIAKEFDVNFEKQCVTPFLSADVNKFEEIEEAVKNYLTQIFYKDYFYKQAFEYDFGTVNGYARNMSIGVMFLSNVDASDIYEELFQRYNFAWDEFDSNNAQFASILARAGAKRTPLQFASLLCSAESSPFVYNSECEGLSPPPRCPDSPVYVRISEYTPSQSIPFKPVDSFISSLTPKKSTEKNDDNNNLQLCAVALPVLAPVNKNLSFFESEFDSSLEEVGGCESRLGRRIVYSNATIYGPCTELFPDKKKQGEVVRNVRKMFPNYKKVAIKNIATQTQEIERSVFAKFFKHIFEAESVRFVDKSLLYLEDLREIGTQTNFVREEESKTFESKEESDYFVELLLIIGGC